MNPVFVVVTACAAASLICWLLSIITREYSWVDRLWSIAPVFYVACFAYAAHWTDPRLNIMILLVLLWGARLTFNFARKGGYKRGGEDYRWAELRRRMSHAQFQFFNFFFIAVFQNILLALLSLPAWIVWSKRAVPLNTLDYVAIAFFILMLLGETIADQQQWRFQANKKHRLQQGQAIERQFVTTGLFRYARHPNFFCEMGIWWSLYLFGVAASFSWLNISIIGPILLTLLFQGSTRFTEELSLKKYPDYADYQQQTWRLIPMLQKKSGDKRPNQ